MYAIWNPIPGEKPTCIITVGRERIFDNVVGGAWDQRDDAVSRGRGVALPLVATNAGTGKSRRYLCGSLSYGRGGHGGRRARRPPHRCAWMLCFVGCERGRRWCRLQKLSIEANTWLRCMRSQMRHVLLLPCVHVQHDTTQHHATQHDATQHNATRHIATQRNTTPHHTTPHTNTDYIWETS